jgi:nucleoside-diphosphate-sugar epimerase
MKILITGGLGHIGSSLLRNLYGHDITIVDNFRTQRYSSLFNLPNKVKFIEKDFINLYEELEGQDIVIHLAAVVDAAGADTTSVVSVNGFATTCFIEACKRAGVSKFIFPSSTSVYGVAADRVWEDDRFINPQSTYAEYKYKIEEQLRVDHGDMDYLVLRFGTIFGTSPGMRFHTAINKFCWQSSLGEPLTIWKESFKLKRPYLALGDACRAIRHFINRPEHKNDVYNILTGNYTAQEIVSILEQELGNIELNMVDTPLLNQYSYEVSCEKARLSGFYAKGDLIHGVKQTLSLLEGVS